MRLRDIIDIIKREYHDKGIDFEIVLFEQNKDGLNNATYSSNENGIVFYEKGSFLVKEVQFDYDRKTCAVTILGRED